MIQAWMCLFCKNLGRHCHWRCVLGGWGASQPRLPLPRLFLQTSDTEWIICPQFTTSGKNYTNNFLMGCLFQSHETWSDCEWLRTSSIIVASLSQTKVRWLFPVESSLESHARAQSRFSASHIPVDHEGQTSATKVVSYCQLLTVCYGMLWLSMPVLSTRVWSSLRSWAIFSMLSLKVRGKRLWHCFNQKPNWHKASQLIAIASRSSSGLANEAVTATTFQVGSCYPCCQRGTSPSSWCKGTDQQLVSCYHTSGFNWLFVGSGLAKRVQLPINWQVRILGNAASHPCPRFPKIWSRAWPQTLVSFISVTRTAEVQLCNFDNK